MFNTSAIDVPAFLRELSLDAYVTEVERHAIDGDMLADLAHCGTLGSVLGMGSLDQTRLRVGLQRLLAASSVNKRQGPEFETGSPSTGADAANKRPRHAPPQHAPPTFPIAAQNGHPADAETDSKTTTKTTVSPTGFVTFVDPPNAQLECPVSDAWPACVRHRQ